MPRSKNKKMNNTLVSVVILNYNGKKFVEKCLESVSKTNYPTFEVIFVDNASRDDSVKLVQKTFRRYPWLLIIQNSKNEGFAEGNNIGVKYAQGKYLVFLNIDTEVDHNWLSELVRVMESDPRIGIAQSKLLLMYNHKRIDSTGGFLKLRGFSRLRGHQEEDQAQYSEVDDIFFASGASMIVRKEVLDEVGLFDPKFFMYSEEVDLCWRVWIRGYRIVFVPTSVVFHAGQGVTKPELRSWLNFHRYKNRIAILLKNYNSWNMVKYVAANIILECGLLPYRILKGQSDIAVAHVKAFLWIVSNFKYLWKKRLEVQFLIRKMPDEHLLSKGLIMKQL